MKSHFFRVALVILITSTTGFTQSKDELKQWYHAVVDEFADRLELPRIVSGSEPYNRIRFNLLSDKYFLSIFGESFDNISIAKRKKLRKKLIGIKKYGWGRSLSFFLWGTTNQERIYNKTIIEIQALRQTRKEFGIFVNKINSNKNIKEYNVWDYKADLDSKYKKLMPSELDPIKLRLDKLQVKTEVATRANGFLSKIQHMVSAECNEVTIMELQRLLADLDNPLNYSMVPMIARADARVSLQQRVDECTSATQKKPGAVKEKGESFLRGIAGQSDIIKTASGVLYEIIKATQGPKPTSDSEVTIHYIGTVFDGLEFDNTYDIEEPYVTKLYNLKPALKEIVSLMSPGSKYRIYSPYQMAFGEKGFEMVKPFAAVIFELELVDFE